MKFIKYWIARRADFDAQISAMNRQLRATRVRARDAERLAAMLQQDRDEATARYVAPPREKLNWPYDRAEPETDNA